MMTCFTSYSLSWPCFCDANLCPKQKLFLKENSFYTPEHCIFSAAGIKQEFFMWRTDVGFFPGNDYEEAILNMETLV